jgi:hypothetical protein
MKKMLIGVLFGVSLLALTGCSEQQYYTLEQDIYVAQVVDYTVDSDDNPEYLEIKLVNPKQNPDMAPAEYLYYKDTNQSDVDNMLKKKDVWILVGKYETAPTIDAKTNKVDTSKATSVEYGVEAVYGSEDDAHKSFPILEKVIPTKISKKVQVDGNDFVHLVLEEDNGTTTSFYPFKVASDKYEQLQENKYYNIKVRLAGPNIKILELQNDITQQEYDNFMQEQAKLRNEK